MGLFSSSLIGLDIGTSSVKLVQLAPKGKDHWVLQAYAIQDLAEEAVEEAVEHTAIPSPSVSPSGPGSGSGGAA